MLTSMSHRPFKNRLYAEFARVGIALSSDKRLEMLDLLAQSPRYVDGLAGEMEMSVANVSQHLQVLRNAKLAESQREGTRVLYRLADESVVRLWLALRGFAEDHLPEIRQLRALNTIEGLDGELPRDELTKLVEVGAAVVIDVRPAIEFDNGHLPGALNMTVDELPNRMDDLPRDKRIVAYCRGPYCLFADEAVALLKQNGFDAVRMEGGWPDWQVENAAAK
jgi:rhodanese-related sulfurtransferase